MPVNIDQNTMDMLNNRKNKAAQDVSDAQNQVTASQAKLSNSQKQLDSLNAIIADCVVVP